MCSRRRAQLIGFGARASLRAIAYIQAQEVAMALINIKDLPQSDELDRRAMLLAPKAARVAPEANVI